MSEKVEKIRENLNFQVSSSALKQNKNGKLSFFQRIEKLLDAGTFMEFGSFSENKSESASILRDGILTGFGMINGKKVVVASQDFSQKGGTLGLVHAKKIVKALDLAVRTRSPFIFIADSGGARIQEGVDALAGFGDIFKANVKASGVIPQIAIILGPCAGGAVYSPALMDFIFMVDKISYMFVTGPKVVLDVTGEAISTDELGGSRVHSQESGVSSFVCKDEVTCFAQVRKLLSFLSLNDLKNDFSLLTSRQISSMSDNSIEKIIPNLMSRPYDVRKVISRISDNEEFMEVFENFAQNIFTGFAKIDRRTVGVIANNPAFLAGTLDVNSSCKAARFIRFCDSFKIPLLTLVDVPGYMPGSQSEKNGIIRHGAKMLYAYSESTVPKVTLIMRKAFGGAYIAMCSKHLGADMVFAYPDSQIAVMGAEGAVDILYSKDIKASVDPQAFRQEKISEYNENYMNPISAAQKGYVDEIIDMRDTKSKITNAFRILCTEHNDMEVTRHGNIPL